MEEKYYIEHLIAQIRNYESLGYSFQVICAILSGDYKPEDIYLAYKAAVILNKDMYEAINEKT